MFLKAAALVGAAYLLGFFSEDVPDTQTKTTETGLEAHQPLNPEVGIGKIYRTQGLEKTIIKELMYSDGQTFPEDYETRLFSFSRESINPDALSDAELDKINQTFDAIKRYTMELFRSPSELDIARTQATDIEAVYIYSFSHKATTLQCLTSNDICQPANAQLITKSNSEYSVLDDYKEMFTYDWILKSSKLRMTENFHDKNLREVLSREHFTNKKLLLEGISGYLKMSRAAVEGEALPTMGYRAVFVIAHPDKDDIYIHTALRSYTLTLDTDQLTNLFKTIPGKQISSYTGLAKKLNKEINNDI